MPDSPFDNVEFNCGTAQGVEEDIELLVEELGYAD